MSSFSAALVGEGEFATVDARGGFSTPLQAVKTRTDKTKNLVR
jgi:hypothetical protein